MTTVKTEFSAGDAAPVVLYAKTNADAREAYPLLQGMFNPGFSISEYDEIALSYTSGDLTGVVYKLLGATVATLTLGYTSGNLTSVIKT